MHRLSHVLSQSFRPTCTFDDEKEYCVGSWDSKRDGESIDYVKRGCFNNGTCVGPNKCACSEGYVGYDCCRNVSMVTALYRMIAHVKNDGVDMIVQ